MATGNSSPTDSNVVSVTGNVQAISNAIAVAIMGQQVCNQASSLNPQALPAISPKARGKQRQIIYLPLYSLIR